MVQSRGVILIQKIKQDNGNIGRNIREIRLARGIGQTELVRLLDLQGIAITRECLVMIERGVLLLYVLLVCGFMDERGTSYEELLN